MGQVNSCSQKLPSHGREKKRNVLEFFNVATENEILQCYPFLSNSMANTIVKRRQYKLFRKLKDVWNFESLFNHRAITTEGSIYEQMFEIQEMFQPVIIEADPPEYEPRVPYVYPPIPSTPSPSSELDDNSQMLLKLLEDMGLVDSWSSYIKNNSISLGEIDESSDGYRLASWNLNRFTLGKARHPGFREAICLTILINRIDLIAFQEVSDAEAVNLLVTEMNNPKLPMLKKWVAANQNISHKKTLWNSITSSQATGQTFQGVEYSSFLFRQNRVQAISTSILGSPSAADSTSSPKYFTRAPFIGKFKVSGHTVVLASVHLKAKSLQLESCDRTTDEVVSLASFVDAVNETFASKVYYIILGDFNLDPGNQAFDELRSRGLHNVISTGISTMLTSAERQCEGVSCFDNAWMSPNLITHPPVYSSNLSSSQLYFNQHRGANVIVQGLRHPLIPTSDGSGFNGPPSDHCPIVFNLDKQ